MNTKEIKSLLEQYRKKSTENFNANFGNKYLEDVSLKSKDIIGIYNDISFLLSACELLAERIEELES